MFMLIFSFKKKLLILLSILAAFSANSKSYAINFELFDQNIYCEGLSAIEKYACLTEHAAKGIELAFPLNGVILKPYEVSVFKAIEAMNLVQNIAGSGRYAYLKHSQTYFVPPPSVFKPPTGKFEPPSMDNQDICLTNGFGICGNHQFLFIAILKLIGVEARAVDFYYSVKGQRKNHAAAEVKINNTWRYFDITWGSYWLNNPSDLLSVESLEDILNGQGKQMINNNSWYVAATHNLSLQGLPNVFSYLNASDLQILRDKGGVLLISFNNGIADFSNQPNYFGKTREYTPLKIKLSGNAPSGDAIMDISGFGGDCKQSCMKVGSRCYPVINGKSRVYISPNSVIEIEGKDSICYAVIGSLKVIN